MIYKLYNEHKLFNKPIVIFGTGGLAHSRIIKDTDQGPVSSKLANCIYHYMGKPQIASIGAIYIGS